MCLRVSAKDGELPEASRLCWLTSLPALIGNDALLQQLLVFANTNRQPVAQLAIVQGVHHLEDVPPTEGQTLRGLLLIIKVGSDEEGISTTRHQYVIIG